jgi:FKBP-type peptidyl-prolyl cis-trans isomerase FkpA
MKKLVLFLLMGIVAFTMQAQNDGFIKAQNNIEYKIYPSANANKIEYGNYIKMHFLQLYRGAKDTVLYDSDDYASPIQPVDTATMPLYYFDIIKQLKLNDSVVMRIIVDSAYKNSQMTMPPMFEPGKFLYTCVKVREIFDTKAKADSAALEQQQILVANEKALSAAAFETDNRILTEYFAKNKITGVTKLPLGTYIKIIKKGVGKNATTADKVKVDYTGKSLAGKTFDSSKDPAFGHVQPYEVDLSKNPVPVIAGWEEALKNMSKGTKALVFVPSPLAYGRQGYPPAIEPNQILQFEMELVSVVPANATPTTKPISKPTKPVVKNKPKAKTK